METNGLKDLMKRSELSNSDDECIILNDEQADDILGGNSYNNCTFTNCHSD